MTRICVCLIWKGLVPHVKFSIAQPIKLWCKNALDILVVLADWILEVTFALGVELCGRE